MIASITFIADPVTDVPRARASYEEVLGLTMTSSFTDSWIEHDIGDATFRRWFRRHGACARRDGGIRAVDPGGNHVMIHKRHAA